MSLLELYVKGWHDSAASVIDLLPTLSEADWSAQTDCPGWTVRDVAAHLAHLENELAGGKSVKPDAGATAVIAAYTQAGVDARREDTPGQLIAEFADAVAVRARALADLPDDPDARAPVTPGGVNWSWDSLLRNRAIDVWVHEQDIRRAINRPGGLDSTGAQIATTTFRLAMSFVIGKKVRPAPGTTVRWHVTGEIPFNLTIVMGDDGRAKPLEASGDDPDVLLTMKSEDFTVLAAGRRTADLLDISVAGDTSLADAVLAAMPVTF
ncbi:MAG: maleylpyruvate isomerase family mycothiol-dependent enzyme [Aeromicrobium sp.]